MEPRLPTGQRVLVDLDSPVMAFGDTVLRLGALQALQAHNPRVSVIASRKRLLERFGIQDLISWKEAAQNEYDWAIPIPRWSNPEWTTPEASYQAYLRAMFGSIPHLAEGLLDCDHRADEVTQEMRDAHPQLNRISVNFLRQFSSMTDIPLTAEDILPRVDVPPASADGRILAIGDWASVEHKRWPHFAALLDGITERFPDVRLAFIDENTAFGPARIAHLRDPDKVVYSPARDEPSMLERYARGAVAFVGNDSGPGHYFSALNRASKPSLTIISRRHDPDRWAPNGLRADYVFLDIEGKPKDRASYFRPEWELARVRRAGDGIEMIPVEYVLQKATEMLERV